MALKLWSKLESNADVTNPQVGTGGAVFGVPTYPAAKFGNGILSDIDNEGCKFPTAGNDINMDEGTIEFWIKPKYAAGTAGQRYLFGFADGDGLRLYIDLDNFGVDSKLIAWIIHEGGNFFCIVYGLTWNIDDLIHVAFTWDRTGVCIGSNKTVALYWNNVEVGSSITTWNATPGIGANMYVGTNEIETAHSDVVIDNIKTHDVCKTDFSDRNDEAAGANQPPTAPTSLQVNDESVPTGANCVTITPQFTAIFNDPDAGDISNAIEIEVGSASGLSDMWDSGWLADSTIDGNRCDAETYAGTALSQGTSYWWRCRFRDDDGGEGTWSSWQEFKVCSGIAEQPGGSIPKRRPFAQDIKQPIKLPVEIEHRVG